MIIERFKFNGKEVATLNKPWAVPAKNQCAVATLQAATLGIPFSPVRIPAK